MSSSSPRRRRPPPPPPPPPLPAAAAAAAAAPAPAPSSMPSPSLPAASTSSAAPPPPPPSSASSSSSISYGVSDVVKGALMTVLSDPIAVDWFGRPVDPVALHIPDYPLVVTNPMDLGTVRARIDSSKYTRDTEVIDDVRLTFLNAMKYNPSTNVVHKAAKRLMRRFDALVSPGSPAGGLANGNGGRKRGVRSKQQRPPAAAGRGATGTGATGNPNKRSKTSNGGSATASSGDMPFKSACMKVLDAIIHHDCSGPFLKPVDPVRDELPDYLQVIEYPMDLSTAKRKLNANKYTSEREFATDVRFIWTNCISYNGSDKGVSRMARQLSQKFDRLFGREFPLAPPSVPLPP